MQAYANCLAPSIGDDRPINGGGVLKLMRIRAWDLPLISDGDHRGGWR